MNDRTPTRVADTARHVWVESRRMRAVQTPIIPVVGGWIRRQPGAISLAQGVVYYDPPPQASETVEDFLRHGDHKYGPVQGQAELRRAILEKLRRENGIDVSGDDNRIIVTAGGNMAFLNALFAITDPGDEVILPLPYYFNHEMAIRMLNCMPLLVPTDTEYRLDVDALRSAINPRTRAIVTISPNNPTGVVYPRDTLIAVNELCRDAGIYHISDEAYEHFVYDGAKHFSPGSLPGAETHTISLYSLSKSYGFAGWRVGYMVLPPQLYRAVLKAQDTNLICATLAAQHAAAAVLNAATEYRIEKLGALGRVRAEVRRELAALEPLCHVPRADGAFYLLMQVHADVEPLQLVERLIREHGVAVLPGTAFGLDSGCHLRVSYGALEPQTAIAGIKRLVHGLKVLCYPSP
ncbi:MAG: pyridoxal phosphate-dependent aminotransferase [Chromatiales bacterium]